MLSIIERKLKGGDCDDVLEVAWSTLWNVTGEPSEIAAFWLNTMGYSGLPYVFYVLVSFIFMILIFYECCDILISLSLTVCEIVVRNVSKCSCFRHFLVVFVCGM